MNITKLYIANLNEELFVFIEEKQIKQKMDEFKDQFSAYVLIQRHFKAAFQSNTSN